MISRNIAYSSFIVFLSILILLLTFSANAGADYQTNLEYNGYIQDSSGDIDVGDYSVPVVYDWNSDGKKDLLVGQNKMDQDGSEHGYISYFENQGTNAAPSFGSPVYITACSGTCTLDVKAAG